MGSRPLVVEPWTEAGRPAMPADGLLVLRLATPDSRNRDSARRLVRNALCRILALLLDCRPESVPLLSPPGQPLRLAGPAEKIGLSVSHETGISLLAIHLHGAVGIDVLRPADIPVDDTELLRLSSDYFGPEAAAQLSLLPQEARRQAFALAWVKLEAGLKCLGEGLAEWSPQRQALLADCRVRALGLPEGLVGAVAHRISR